MDITPAAAAGFRPPPSGPRGDGQASRAADRPAAPEAVTISLSKEAEAAMTEAPAATPRGGAAEAMMADEALSGAFRNLGQLVSQLARDLYVTPTPPAEGSAEPPIEARDRPTGETTTAPTPNVEIDARSLEDGLLEALDGGGAPS